MILMILLAGNSSIARAQKADQPGIESFRVGDSWTFLINHPRFTMTETFQVSVVAGGQLAFEPGGVRWPARDIPYPDAKTPWRAFPLQVGKKWTFLHEGRYAHGEHYSVRREARVLALEYVEVPAGRFLAYKIEYEGQNTMAGQPPYPVTDIDWYSPRVMMNVKRVQRTRDFEMKVELIAFSRGPTSPGR